MIAANLVLLGAIACSFWLGWVARGQVTLRRRALPPATRHQIERDRRANRPILTAILTAVPTAGLDRSFISPARASFDDDEETR